MMLYQYIEQHLFINEQPRLVCPSGGVFNRIFNLGINVKQTSWFLNFNSVNLM